MSRVFQVVSDLHIEYKNDETPDPLDFIEPKEDILIMAGDIGSVYKPIQLIKFLRKVCKLFKMVVYVPGNHEYYVMPDIPPKPFYILQERLRDICKGIPGLYLLDNDSLLIDNVYIAGTTLWSDPKIQLPRYLVRIHGMNTDKYKSLHNDSVEYIEQSISYCKKNGYKLLMISHYPPTYDVLKGTSKRVRLHSMYATDMEYLLSRDNVDTWVCGHVHKNFDFITTLGTRVLGNQKGKPKDKIDDFSKEFLFAV